MSAAAHGRVALAVRSQAGGAALFVLVAVFGLAGAADAATGGEALGRLGIRRWGWWLVAATGVLLAGWGVSLASGFASGRWPLR